MAKTRIAVAGAGLIGQEHCKLIAASDAAELAGIADPAPAARGYAASLGVPHFDDLETMLDETGPGGAVVALPTGLHLSAGRACIARDIPCLMEKPVAATLKEAFELARASEAAGIPVLVGHHRRHSVDIRLARETVASGGLGRIVTVSGMSWVDKPDKYFDVAWRRQEGGGTLLINLIHDIDCLRFILGEISRVSAFTSNAVRGLDVEDTASVSFEFESGVLGGFTISDAVASPYSWERTSGQALYFPHQPENYLFIGGRDGALEVPTMEHWHHGAGGGDWQSELFRETLPLDGSQTYENQLAHFLKVIDGDEPPVIDAEDGARTLAVLLAVKTAAREGRVVEVAEMLEGL
ncbi:Gfo/Idh/MocA family oxidoreductase [Nisaea acidiphila]|uniref:Gfo/Idh/MocA family oxidoreductase n=1 Tax=Nisaea acidiphila TaxID=1862145 RepID=A0A9J7AKL9_9PROT|nr:Gfo/Idh/MocA family oxidoreductase [Nisaea acidiphila]UUX48203.1 Gfo/Idh/MocA family oxidoreductase [Nisaea acidiphila]